MQFLFYFAVCLGSFLLSLQLFTSTTTKRRPAEDLFFAERHRQAEASRPYSTQSPSTKPARAPEMIEFTPDVSAAAPEAATATPDVSAAAPEMATATPNVAAAAPETTPAPVVAGQRKSQLVPKDVNARAEAVFKKKRVVSKYPRDDDPRNPIWWLWGLSDVR